MKIDPKEVAEIKWLSLEDFERLLYSTEFVPHGKEYKDTVLAFIKSASKNAKSQTALIKH